MLRDLESIKKDVSDVVTEMSVNDTRRNTLLDAIEKIDALSEHFINDRK